MKGRYGLTVIASLTLAGAYCLPPRALAASSAAALVEVSSAAGSVVIQPYAANIIGIHIEPMGQQGHRTLVLDPALRPAATASFHVVRHGDTQMLSSSQLSVIVRTQPFFSVDVRDADGHRLLSLQTETTQSFLRGPGSHSSLPVVLRHDQSERLYGIRGLPWHDDIDPGILRSSGGTIAAGFQGDGGAPFFFSRRYGVLADSDGGSFVAIDDTLRLRGGSRPDSEYFVMVGPPLKTMAALALLTGRPPMPPKWTLGFLNSQWGSTEQEWRQVSARYQAEGIPVSAFILDFDWKAWGEDDYGEWRWNSTRGIGNVSADKFPDGASGAFARELLAQGIHLVGIVKPRIILTRPDGQPMQAAAYARQHHFFYPGEAPSVDYFSHRRALDIDFASEAARRWFWMHLEPAFRAGIAGWWNDEADQSGTLTFNNFQFLNMGRMEYEGQRSASDQRVWSINRNYYLGAARYGYAEWSGDITTGFQSMAYQRRRLVAAVNIGEPNWSMDTGGFVGHPSPENYARWMQFAAFVPIFRVHGAYQEKRQPWVYGPVAEEAARRAILLRYRLMPYIYSMVWKEHQTGIGLVRPLFWEFADEPCALETTAWMFGDSLLVSPVVEPTPGLHRFYLPRGSWIDFETGRKIQGGRDLAVRVDSPSWQEMPLYIRGGSILASRPAQADNRLSAGGTLQLDVFPSPAHAAQFELYDDDGTTYAYERGVYFRRRITAIAAAASIEIHIDAPSGAYREPYALYDIRVHQRSAAVLEDGHPLALAVGGGTAAAGSAAVPGGTPAARWRRVTDRFGEGTEIELPVDTTTHRLTLLPARSRTARE